MGVPPQHRGADFLLHLPRRGSLFAAIFLLPDFQLVLPVPCKCIPFLHPSAICSYTELFEIFFFGGKILFIY